MALWDKQKSKEKANGAAATAATGGGIVAGAFIFVRSQWPDIIPWDASNDVAVAAGITSVFAWVVAYFKNKAKHTNIVDPDIKGYI